MHYELRWIIPADATRAGRGFYGKTVVEVEDAAAARNVWDSITDVDLFYPDGRSSASDPDVRSGELQDGQTLARIDAKDFDAARALADDWRAELVAIREIPVSQDEAIGAAVADAKREILEDVRDGRVPADVPTFSALHDYVDANEYGGLTEDRAAWSLSTVAAVQDELDRWIVRGGVRGEVAS